jgi:hypothetical protein
MEQRVKIAGVANAKGDVNFIHSLLITRTRNLFLPKACSINLLKGNRARSNQSGPQQKEQV